MSGFVATAPTTELGPISSGAWYPSIDPTAARAVMRIDGTVTNDRLVEILQLSMSAVEDLLDAWQQQQLALDRQTMADVPSKEIGNESRLVLLYRRAVYATAQADLIEKYPDFTATDDGRKRAESMECAVADHRRNVRLAIRDILGRPRADVELI
jgi:hypothetical protein